jgi:hypothetical protein
LNPLMLLLSMSYYVGERYKRLCLCKKTQLSVHLSLKCLRMSYFYKKR